MDFTKFNIKKTNNDVKIIPQILKDKTSNINDINEQISNSIFDKYTELLNHIQSNYCTLFKSVTKIVTLIDYYTTISKVSRENNYCKPTIDSNNNTSYVNVKQIRHPIVERIIEHEYVPHDIHIGHDLKGMLIYGLNSAGKSVLMKSIGISVIMAQAGFYVPATKFTYYPYKSLYTRITGNDNLFRGLSSFSLEMVELNSILKRADKSTLVIGDEVCRGTEHISGNALVASSLLKLSDVKSSFVFATHLHEMMNLEEIKMRENIKAYHLSVEINNDVLVYDRILKEGSGERIYGILVAKNIIQDTEFINKALEIKNILLDLDPEASSISKKKSKYNSKIIMDKCECCGKKNSYKTPTPLEVHHINFQKNCKDGFVIEKPHIKKNHISNLTVLCNKCHDDLHSGKFNIESYKNTSKGKKLMINKY
jgi:DNA mismatch repair protein MutS